MKIILIYNDAYPYGKACANRVHLFAKGLLEAGSDVEVLIHRPTEVYGFEILNYKTEGIYDEIPFFYSAGTTLRSKSFIARRYYDLKGFLKAGLYLFNHRKSISGMLFVSGGLTQSLFYKLVTKISGILYLHQKGELPFIYSSKNWYKKIYQNIYIKYIYKLFDGLIVISENLFDYFKEKVAKNTPIILIPILSNSCDFISSANKKMNNKFSLTYAGTLCQKKDGVLDLIRSVKFVLDKGYNIHLNITGDTQITSDKEKIKNLIEELELQKSINVTGYLPRDKYLELLQSSNLLVLAKPKSIEAEYCFPTKLGEYLLTGNPILTTINGVIPDFIKDGKNGFLTEPDKPEAFADKVISIIDEYEKAEIVGRKGRETAIQNFDYKVNGVRLYNFIKDILKNKKQESVVNQENVSVRKAS